MRLAVALTLASLSTSALAQTPPSPSAPAASAPHEPTPTQQAILRGAAAYRQQDWDGAASGFREAARLAPESALPQLYLGYTAAARGDTASAQGFFREALRLATVAADDLNQGRARVALAGALEAGGQWDAAPAEWEQFVRFAESHAAAVPVGIGRARLDALARRTTAATESEPVRRRIEERLRANASGAN